MTFSIVALDEATGDLGVAVQSKFLAVGAVVPWARAGVGAVATQSLANVTYGPDGLALLEEGASASEALGRLIVADDLREERQAGVVDAKGGVATYTGRNCFAWAGGRLGPNYAAQGNILAGPEVVDGLADTFETGGIPFPELLIACLAAADDAGGDRRGRESAALLVVRSEGGYGGGNDRMIDLRVDQHDDPITELGRVLAFQHLYFDKPNPDELLPVDETLARELRAALERVGGGPFSRLGELYVRMSGESQPEDATRPFVGEPRALPTNWDPDWQRSLGDWMAVENLEERAAAPGWIDPQVLRVLRSKRSS